MIQQLDQVAQKNVLAEQNEKWQGDQVAGHRNQRFHRILQAMGWMLGKVAAAKKRPSQQIAPRTPGIGHQFVRDRFVAPHELKSFVHHPAKKIDVLSRGVEFRPEGLVGACQNLRL